MKKILIVITTSFVPWGGLTTVMMNYYRAMDKDDLQIDFASTNDVIPPGLKQELYAGGSGYYCLGNRKRESISYVKRLYGLIRRNKYDVIHINANSATALLELMTARICGISSRIAHIHSSTGDYVKLHLFLRPLFCFLSTNLLACSLKSGRWAFGKRDFTVLNNAINAAGFSYDEKERRMMRERFGIAQHCLVIGHVGKFYKPKNHDFLLDVFHAVHKRDADTLLLLAGDGELRRMIEEKAKRLGLWDAVIFLGMVQNARECLSAMDCFVFPSLWEGLPLALVEAQASGLKCVASAAVTEEANVTGRVVYMPKEADAESWAREILKRRVYDRAGECRENQKLLSERGYDVSRNARRIHEIYMG